MIDKFPGQADTVDLRHVRTAAHLLLAFRRRHREARVNVDVSEFTGLGLEAQAHDEGREAKDEFIHLVAC